MRVATAERSSNATSSCFTTLRCSSRPSTKSCRLAIIIKLSVHVLGHVRTFIARESRSSQMIPSHSTRAQHLRRRQDRFSLPVHLSCSDARSIPKKDCNEKRLRQQPSDTYRKDGNIREENNHKKVCRMFGEF